MVSESEEQLDISVKGNHKLYQVNQFKYLGSVMNSKVGCEQAINARITLH